MQWKFEDVFGCERRYVAILTAFSDWKKPKNEQFKLLISIWWVYTIWIENAYKKQQQWQQSKLHHRTYSQFRILAMLLCPIRTKWDFRFCNAKENSMENNWKFDKRKHTRHNELDQNLFFKWYVTLFDSGMTHHWWETEWETISALTTNTSAIIWLSSQKVFFFFALSCILVSSLSSYVL